MAGPAAGPAGRGSYAGGDGPAGWLVAGLAGSVGGGAGGSWRGAGGVVGGGAGGVAKSLDLFEAALERRLAEHGPLAARMRPRSLDDVVGQRRLLAPGRPLRALIEADRLSSAVLWGPPGTGKTTVAQLVAGATKKAFVSMSAVAAGVKDVRETVEAARNLLAVEARGTVLFLDEVHRFNRAQQDALLPSVESGELVFIGATTENPFFSVNGPLLSRSSLFRLEPLSEADLLVLLRRALEHEGASATEDALALLARLSEGDARSALNGLEVALALADCRERGWGERVPEAPAQRGGRPVEPGGAGEPVAAEPGGAGEPLAGGLVAVEPVAGGPGRRLGGPGGPAAGTVAGPREPGRPAVGRPAVVLEDVEAARSTRALRYGDDEHYDVISAFIKSVRGSDPDAGLYWLARMLEAGEDARFIARRLVILASEDVGMADPQSLLVADAAARAVEFVGLPEAQLNLAHAVVHLANAPKSNSVTAALGMARSDVQEFAAGEVPKHLRDSHYRGAARLGHGKGYVYPHGEPGGWVDQQYRPPHLEDRVYWEPTGRGEDTRKAAGGRAGGEAPAN